MSHTVLNDRFFFATYILQNDSEADQPWTLRFETQNEEDSQSSTYSTYAEATRVAGTMFDIVLLSYKKAILKNSKDRLSIYH